MSKQSKRVQQPQPQVSAHPETHQPAPDVPGDERSKVETTKQRDGRTAQDKDGNEQQPRTGKNAAAR